MKLWPFVLTSTAMILAFAGSAARAVTRKEFTPRDLQHLQTLKPEVRAHFETLLRKAYEIDPRARIDSSRRTVAEQDALYAQGRTKPGTIITNAHSCYSWHVQGRAIDIGGVPEDKLRLLAVWWKSIGGKWGGDFDGLDDPVHFEFHPGMRIEDECK